MTVIRKILDIEISNDKNDTYCIDGNTMANKDVVYLNSNITNQLFSGLRFENVTIPQSARIITAIITAEIYGVGSGNVNPEFYLYGEYVGNSEILEGGTILNKRKLTPNFVVWSDRNITMGSPFTVTSPDIKDIIQIIVNRSDWKSGNALTIIGVDKQSTYRFAICDSSYWKIIAGIYDKTKLHVEYEIIDVSTISIGKSGRRFGWEI